MIMIYDLVALKWLFAGISLDDFNCCLYLYLWICNISIRNNCAALLVFIVNVDYLKKQWPSTWPGRFFWITAYYIARWLSMQLLQGFIEFYSLSLCKVSIVNGSQLWFHNGITSVFRQNLKYILQLRYNSNIYTRTSLYNFLIPNLRWIYKIPFYINL